MLGDKEKSDLTKYDFSEGRMKQQTVQSSREIGSAADFNKLKESCPKPQSFKISQTSINYLTSTQKELKSNEATSLSTG